MTVPAVILHEVSHGVAALWFGDDTAKRAGRLTLNPVPHIDPVGTLLVPVLLSLSGLGAFGYAKPVPVNVHRLRNPREQALYVSLAGPATNVILALLAAAVLRSVFADELRSVYAIADLSLLPQLVCLFGLVNVILAVFNALPIPPLDGSALVERVLPRSWWPNWLKFRQWGFAVVLVIVLAKPGFLQRIFEPFVDRWFDLLA